MEFLSFENETKSCAIDLATLDKTLKFEDAGGKLPASAPVHHADLIKSVFEISHKHLSDKSPILSPIVIKQNNCKRVMFKGPANECPVKNYAIERLVCKINLSNTTQFKGIGDAEGDMSIGISYNEKGIQMAFGHNVHVCQNLNVFGDRVFSTYGSGNNKTSFEKGMQLLEHWIQNLEENMNNAANSIDFLRSRVISENERLRVFGKIYEMAIRKNSGDNDIDNPLNVTECNKMVMAGFDSITKDKEITAWDLTNWATSTLKPESSDMLNLLSKNNRLNNFLLKEFNHN